MSSIKEIIANFIAKYFGTDLKSSSAAALAVAANTKASIKAEEERLAKLKTAAVTTVTGALSKLQSDKLTAEQANAQAELDRIQSLTDFDNATDAQIAAILKRLEALKAKRADAKDNLEEAIEDDREEFATEVKTATDAEAQLAAELADLIIGADAQTGLNNAGN